MPKSDQNTNRVCLGQSENFSATLSFMLRYLIMNFNQQSSILCRISGKMIGNMYYHLASLPWLNNGFSPSQYRTLFSRKTLNVDKSVRLMARQGYNSRCVRADALAKQINTNNWTIILGAYMSFMVSKLSIVLEFLCY